MRNGKQNPYVFIVGCPRSGTTLLRRMLDAHPELAITRETHWIPGFFEKPEGVTPEGLVTPELGPKLFEHSQFRKLGIGHDQLRSLINSAEPPSYAALVTAIFNIYGKAQGKPFVGDKTPGYVRKLWLLHSLWPAARFVHLVRDGRDVCLSAINWKEKANSFAKRFPTWSEDPVSTAAAWWKWYVQPGREAGYKLGPELYYEMHYESLVSNPAKECEALCKFLDLPYTDAILRFHEGRTNSEPGLDAKHAWLPITPGLRDWRTQMGAEDLERFEAVAGDLLEELGYPRAVRRPERDAQERASLIYDTFTQHARPRQRHLSTKVGETV